MRKDNARKDSEVETLTTKGSQIKSSLLSEKGMEREFEESLKKKAWSIHGAKDQKRFQGSARGRTTGVLPL